MAPARKPTRRNETAEEIARKLFVRNLPRKLNEVSALCVEFALINDPTMMQVDIYRMFEPHGIVTEVRFPPADKLPQPSDGRQFDPEHEPDRYAYEKRVCRCGISAAFVQIRIVCDTGNV